METPIIIQVAALHPKARIESIDEIASTFVFSMLDEAEQSVGLDNLPGAYSGEVSGAALTQVIELDYPPLPPVEPPTPKLVVELNGRYPKARIDNVDQESKIFSFAYLNAEGRQVDSGGSIGKYLEEYSEEALIEAIDNPLTEPMPVPAEVGAGQIRAAMIASGIAANVDALDALITTALNAAISDSLQRAVALALWQYAGSFKRDNAFVEAARQALGKSHTEINELFRLANTF